MVTIMKLFCSTASFQHSRSCMSKWDTFYARWLFSTYWKFSETVVDMRFGNDNLSVTLFQQCSRQDHFKIIFMIWVCGVMWKVLCLIVQLSTQLILRPPLGNTFTVSWWYIQIDLLWNMLFHNSACCRKRQIAYWRYLKASFISIKNGYNLWFFYSFSLQDN